jgi:hypothetical protein
MLIDKIESKTTFEAEEFKALYTQLKELVRETEELKFITNRLS